MENSGPAMNKKRGSGRSFLRWGWEGKQKWRGEKGVGECGGENKGDNTLLSFIKNR